MELLIREWPVILPHEMYLEESLAGDLRQVAEEWSKEAALRKEGLSPVGTVLFEGPPGTGKTLAARWLAKRLACPLLRLDLSTIFNSHLGCTAGNIRNIFDIASASKCVLFLDELDAVGSSRTDRDGGVGEINRVVVAVMQRIDEWPGGSLLVAATNHTELIDKALLSRFESRLAFGNPTRQMIRGALPTFLPKASPQDLDAAAKIFDGRSFRDIKHESLRLRKSVILRNTTLSALLADMGKDS